jgi:hypothetical protein
MATYSLSYKDIAHVLKFNGTNFSNWKFQLFLVLKHSKVLDIVLGKEKKSVLISVTDQNGISTNDSAEIYLWVDKDENASISNSGTVEVKWQNSLINCQASHDM